VTTAYTRAALRSIAFMQENVETERAGGWVSRAIDIVIALAAILFLLPLLLVIALCVYAADPGPILFAQTRIGYRGRRFRCLKFRTMAVDAERRLHDLLERDPAARAEWAANHKLRDDPRIVGIGRFLRKSSLDELPQLFNVLVGHMSLVGPRPIVDAEVPRYGRYFAHYCAVRPGITGLWQISGRSDTSYRRRVAFDVLYSRSRTVRSDMKILVTTIPCILLAKGSY